MVKWYWNLTQAEHNKIHKRSERQKFSSVYRYWILLSTILKSVEKKKTANAWLSMCTLYLHGCTTPFTIYSISNNSATPDALLSFLRARRPNCASLLLQRLTEFLFSQLTSKSSSRVAVVDQTQQLPSFFRQKKKKKKTHEPKSPACGVA